MTKDLWICAAGDGKVVLRCDRSALTAYEARQFGARKLGADPAAIDVKLVVRESARAPEPEALPDWRELGRAGLRDQGGSVELADVVEVRWTGSDYSHGGSSERRRMQERAPGDEEWTDA